MHQIEIPDKLIPVFFNPDGTWNPKRYKGSYGGRGSAKSKTFAKMTAIRAMQLASLGETGVVLCGREIQNSLDESSLAEVKYAIQDDPVLSNAFDVGEKYVRTKCGRISYVFQGLKHNIDAIKSKAKILICWVDEAEAITDECWRKITPTVREQGSEIWITWNPERKGSPTDLRFRKDPPKNSVFVMMNWRDNPWFGQTALNDERLEDKEKRPDTYDHVWEGGYLEVKPGSYYVNQIIKAKEQDRWLVDVPENPLLIIRLFADIGGTGAKADNFVFWAYQYEGKKINYLNHYESQGQDIGHHVNWLNSQGYTTDRAKIFLPHDGETNDKVLDINYRKAFEDAGYSVEVVPNQGKGAAKNRVEAVRNHFNRMWFDKKCEAGCTALAFYGAKIDEKRGIDLGPNHDWSSHSCLPAGVKVSTARGLVNIEDVTPYDFVDINGVYARVTNSGYIKDSSILEIELSTGEVLRCTPEHKIFTTKGLLKADELSYNDVISTEAMPLWNIKKLSIAGIRESITENLKAKNTGSGIKGTYTLAKRAACLGCCIEKFLSFTKATLTKEQRLYLRMATRKTFAHQTLDQGIRTLKENRLLSMSHRYSMEGSSTGSQVVITNCPESMVEHTCTDMCGPFTMGRYLKSTISTIRMVTSLITGLKTSNALNHLFTQACTARKATGLEVRQTKYSLMQQEKRQKNGTDQRQEESGIQSMQKELIITLKKQNFLAQFVNQLMKLLGRKGLFTAQDYARVKRITEIKNKVPVYDITVDHQKCYYANGVLVSNSDAHGGSAIVYEEPKEFKPLNYPGVNTA